MWLLRALGADADHPLSFRLMPGTVKTVGRLGAADFCLDAPLVSRLHCRIEVAPDGTVEIIDLDSTNGTWIDGVRISRAPLLSGNVLRVGRVDFALEDGGDAGASGGARGL